MGSLVCIPLLILYDILYNMFFANKKKITIRLVPSKTD